jgi:hypothetical protein
MARYFYAWVPFGGLSAVLLFIVPFLGLIVAVVFAAGAVAALGVLVWKMVIALEAFVGFVLRRRPESTRSRTHSSAANRDARVPPLVTTDGFRDMRKAVETGPFSTGRRDLNSGPLVPLAGSSAGGRSEPAPRVTSSRVGTGRPEERRVVLGRVQAWTPMSRTWLGGVEEAGEDAACVLFSSTIPAFQGREWTLRRVRHALGGISLLHAA